MIYKDFVKTFAEFGSHYIKAVRENLWLGFDLFLTTEHRHVYKTRNDYVLILFPRCAAGKQLLPLSSSMHGGVSQLAWQQHSGEPNNLVRMRSQSFGQSAPSLTAGQVSACAPHMRTNPLYLISSNTRRCKHRVQNASENLTNASESVKELQHNTWYKSYF